MGLAPASLRVTVSVSSYRPISLAVNGTAVLNFSYFYKTLQTSQFVVFIVFIKPCYFHISLLNAIAIHIKDSAGITD
jgi:hypothetical protein